MSKHNAPPGWYSHKGDMRWWDGQRWTDHVQAPPQPQYAAPRQAAISPVQEKDSLETPAYWFAVLLPIVGFVMGIILLARNRVGPGLAAILLSILSAIVATALLYG